MKVSSDFAHILFINSSWEDFDECIHILCFFQVRAAGELSGHAPAAKQKDHEEAEGGAQWPVQTSGQQRSSNHWREYCDYIQGYIIKNNTARAETTYW